MIIFFILFLIILQNIHGHLNKFPDCKIGPLSSFPICNQSLSSHQRAIDLISRLTTAEKMTQMTTKADAITRLGLPEFQWWSEGLHGIA